MGYRTHYKGIAMDNEQDFRPNEQDYASLGMEEFYELTQEPLEGQT